MAGETVIVAPAAPEAVISAAQETPAVTVQETVQAVEQVAGAIERAAEELRREADPQIMEQFGILNSRLDTLLALVDEMGSLISNAAVATVEAVAEVVEEAEEAEEVTPEVVEQVEQIPPDTIPPPEAPSVRAKRKRYFL